MPSKLKSVLFLGVAGGVVVALRKKAGTQDGEPDTAPRYAPPAEAGAQPPSEPGGPPADDAQATVARSVPAEELHTKAHDLPPDTVVPDASSADPSVQEAEDAAASDAAAIGEKGDEPQP
jgi:hypothetical protein